MLPGVVTWSRPILNLATGDKRTRQKVALGFVENFQPIVSDRT